MSRRDLWSQSHFRLMEPAEKRKEEPPSNFTPFNGLYSRLISDHFRLNKITSVLDGIGGVLVSHMKCLSCVSYKMNLTVSFSICASSLVLSVLRDLSSAICTFERSPLVQSFRSDCWQLAGGCLDFNLAHGTKNGPTFVLLFTRRLETLRVEWSAEICLDSLSI